MSDPFTPEARAYIAAHPEVYARRPVHNNPNWFTSETERNRIVFSVGAVYATAVCIVAACNPAISTIEVAALALAYMVAIPVALLMLAVLGG